MANTAQANLEVSGFPVGPKFLSKKSLILIFAPLILLVFLIVILLVLRSSQTPPKMPAIDIAQINFSSPLEKESFLKNFEAAEKEKDQAKKYQLLEESFTILMGFYIGSHDPATRQQAEIFAKFMAKEFPENYQKKQSMFTVPCLDLACGSANYPVEIKNLQTELKAISALDQQVLKNLLKKFEAAAISADKSLQWTNYLAVFQSLKSEYARTKDTKISAAGEKLKNFLKQNYPQDFAKFERNFPEAMKIS